MFDNNPNKRQFSIATSKSLRIDRGKPLQERLKITSLTTNESGSGKKKMVLYILLLIIVIALIARYGLNPSESGNVKIEEKEIEKVNGE